MSKTVMIVEDNELNMKLFHDLLEAYGYHPIGTRNGIEALLPRHWGSRQGLIR
jgi:two-component system, cell cycle response regulator DivK